MPIFLRNKLYQIWLANKWKSFQWSTAWNNIAVQKQDPTLKLSGKYYSWFFKDMHCVEISKGDEREYFRLTLSTHNWDYIHLLEGSLNQNQSCPEFHLLLLTMESLTTVCVLVITTAFLINHLFFPGMVSLEPSDRTHFWTHYIAHHHRQVTLAQGWLELLPFQTMSITPN